MIAPTLHTARLTLRMPVLADFGPRAEFAGSARSVYEGGPINRNDAWRVFASEVGQWPLTGYGPFSIADRTTGEYLEKAGVYHLQDYPEPELGWFVISEAEGHGIALEAARAVMVWVRKILDWDHIVSYIDPDNFRSIALGHRLGGVIDRARPGQDPTDVVILHDLRGLA